MNLKRIEVYSLYEQGPVKKAFFYLIEAKESIDEDILKKIFCDPLAQRCSLSLVETKKSLQGHHGVEMSYRPGVTDNLGMTACEILSVFGLKAQVSSGHIYYSKDLPPDSLLHQVNRDYANCLVHRVSPLSEDRFTNINLPKVKLRENDTTHRFHLKNNIDHLLSLAKKRTLALSRRELETIIAYFGEERETITDVELEILAQTWSEHCKHKIFNATIDYRESEHRYKKIGHKTIKGLFPSYIEAVTKKLNNSFLISVFKDNAGIVRFDQHIDLCFKVETHNAPSALDPYGGALTGILGVNRDILGCGLGAKPIGNTNIFCLPPLELEDRFFDNLPKNVMPPKRMLEGVHRGVEDGGNKSGIPTVNGSMFFDESYAGRPLIYVGCIGMMPQSINGRATSEKKAKDGDLIYMVGGAVGVDGIHGATFSSMGLGESSSHSVVQIGDPFTQKKLTDFLLEARDKNLFHSVTDNGAGGLSSSVGEMARDCNGAVIHIETVPLKYPHLCPWEIIVSESQERMTFAVSSKHSNEFEKLSFKHGIKASCIGRFEDSGYFSVANKGEQVAKIDMHFLHHGNPSMHLSAKWDGPRKQDNPYRQKKRKQYHSPLEALCDLLQHPNITSKEFWVRRYDQEVQAQTIVRPFYQGKYSGPSDGGVLQLKGHGGAENNAVALAHGYCPYLAEIDPYLMAFFSMDECVRNLLCSGGHLSKMALLDNFCWPNPIYDTNNPEGEHRLAQLVRACEGLFDSCLAYGLPLISGKDSMKNDYNGLSRKGEKLSFSVLPTLLVSGIAQVHTPHLLPSFAPSVGEVLVEIGTIKTKRLQASTFSKIFQTTEDSIGPFDFQEHFDVLKKVELLRNEKLLSSLHDISDGGALVAAVEMLFTLELGLTINTPKDHMASFFGEGPTCFMATVPQQNISRVQDIMKKNLQVWGEISETKKLMITTNDKKTEIPICDLVHYWNGGLSRAKKS